MKKKKAIIILIMLITIIIGIYIYYKKEYKFTNKLEKTKTYTPITYEICDNNSCIYLLGSIHIGDNRITNFDEKLIKLYDKSKYLAVELDTQNINMNLTDFIAPKEETLDTLLSQELKEKLTSFLSSKGFLSYEQLKFFKVGYVSNSLSLLSAMELGLTSEGVDEYFLTKAHKDNKEIIELETYQEQIDLLLNYPNEIYINQIENIIENYEDGKKELKELYEFYLKSDKEKLEKLISDEDEIMTEEERNYQNDMIYNRNNKMSQKIEEFLKEDKEVFMIVGSAHVLGKYGIINSLNDKNYKINLIN